jgi:hypothetical protein
MFSKNKFFTSIVILTFAAFTVGSAQAEQSAEPRKVAERLALFAQNAVTINGFDDMVLSLSKYDRDRLAENQFTAYDRLNIAIAQLHRSYASAYGRTLSITPESIGELRIVQTDKDKIVCKLSNRSTEIRLCSESFVGNRWRIDLTNPKADLLADTLARQCTALAATQWPRDPEAGRRLVAERILSAMTQPPNTMTVLQSDAK